MRSAVAGDDPPADFYLALVEALVSGSGAAVPEELHRDGIATAATFARAQIGALAPDLRWPLLTALQAFQLLIFITHLTRFARLPLERRRRILQAYAFGGFPPMRQVFRPIRATALLAYYETVVSPGRTA